MVGRTKGQPPFQTKPKNRAGKIALLALIFMLVTVILMALVGNAGHGVKQKMEVQHAADAAGFAGSLWMARGMNGITTSNHLIGEATAIGVMHDAIGGPELRLGLETNTLENQQLDTAIRILQRPAPIASLGTYYPFLAALTGVDRAIIEAVVKRTSPQNDGDLKAFATLYDSRITLKRELRNCLAAKSAANLVLLIPPPFDLPWSIGAVATHAMMTVRIALVGKEWLLLEVLEIYANAASPIQETAMASQLIPTLAQFAAAIAGLDLARPEQAAKGGLAIDRIESAISEINDQHHVTVAAAPDVEERRLPVMFEPPANMKGRSADWPSGWGSDQPLVLSETSEAVDSIFDKLNRGTQKLSGAIRSRLKAIENLNVIQDELNEKLAADELNAEVRSDYEAELKVVEAAIQEIQSEVEQLLESQAEIASQRSLIDQVLSASGLGQSQNPSMANIPEQLDPHQEKTTQWLRATVPNVDAFRAPLLGLMQSQLPISRAADHYEKWTNRYAMIHAWRHRTGMRLQKTGTGTANWNRQRDPLSMIVLSHSFDNERSIKGRERWTRNEVRGKQLAEDLFTLFFSAHREHQPLFGGEVMTAGQTSGMTGLAQSIVYNANPQRTSENSPNRQPVVGWDTLNWDASSNSPLPEWGAPATVEAARWPWQIFNNPANAPEMKLNWQAKLIPVTKRRLELAAELMDGDAQHAVQLAVEHADLISH